MIYVLKEFFQRIANNISYFFTDTFFPFVKTALLYPFAKAGIVSAQLDIAQIHLDNFFCRTMKIPKKWLKKGIEQKKSACVCSYGKVSVLPR